MEAGEREPSATQIESIAQALGLSVAAFYGEVPGDEGRAA